MCPPEDWAKCVSRYILDVHWQNPGQGCGWYAWEDRLVLTPSWLLAALKAGTPVGSVAPLVDIWGVAQFRSWAKSWGSSLGKGSVMAAPLER